MPEYRIFTNDRGKKKGVPLYSAYCKAAADTPEAALKTVHSQLGKLPLAPVKAIQWPPNKADQAWLKEHVDVR